MRAASQPPGRERIQLLTKVARLYHDESLRQPEIAARLGLSQARVSRLLKEAADRGIVRTVVVPPPGVHADLERLLMHQYGLRDAVVVDAEGDGPAIQHALGSGGAVYLDTIVLNDDVIGVSSWSATLLSAVERMTPKPTPVADRVVQMVGGVGSPQVQMQATRLAARLAEVTGAAPVFVPSPGLVGSPSLREALMADAGVMKVRSGWKEISIALLGIGTLEPSVLLRQSGNSVSDAEQAALRHAGAVGDVCLRFFDRVGAAVETTFDQRVIGIDREDIAAIPRRVGIAGGLEKLDAIKAAVVGGWVNILVTDAGVASHLTAPN